MFHRTIHAWLVALAIALLACTSAPAQDGPLPDPPNGQDPADPPNGQEPPDSEAAQRKRAQDLMQRLVTARRRLDAIRRDVKKHPPAKLNLDDRYLRARLIFDKIRIVVEDETLPMTTRIDRVDPLIASFESTVKLLADDKPLKVPRAGLQEWAYLAEQDGSVQPYYAYVPENVVGKKNVPMLVFLHGYVSYINKVNWLELSLPPSLTALAERKGFIVALPFGRSNTEFMGIGEVDVLHVVELMKKRYGIDAMRIVLSGISMGGSGTWTIAAHYPHVFAGIAPVAGRTDYYLWKGLDRTKVDPFKRILTDINYVSAMPGNFSNMGVYVCHGEMDTLVKVDQSRTMVDRLNKLGIPVVYQEVKAGDHWIWDRMFESPAFARWFDRRRVDLYPRKVHYTTHLPRYNRAYWVTVDTFKRLDRPASVDVEVVDERTVRVTAHNVESMRLNVDTKALGLADNFEVDCHALKRVPSQGPDNTVLLTETGRPVNTAGTKAAAPGAGPVHDAYSGPFVMVTPQMENPKKPEGDGLTAFMNVYHWMRYARGNPKVIEHDKVRGVDILENNLVLFGTAQTNRQIERIAEKLPVKMEPGKITVGKHVFEGPNVGAVVCYPNPLNPKRYVVVYSGPYYGGRLELNHRFDWLPDYLVYDDKIESDGTNRWLCAGFFDNHWKLDDSLMWVRDKDKPGTAPAPEGP